MNKVFDFLKKKLFHYYHLFKITHSLIVNVHNDLIIFQDYLNSINSLFIKIKFILFRLFNFYNVDSVNFTTKEIIFN